jgi:hypothetical protein
VALLACGALLGACGGTDGDGDVEGLLDRAFRESIGSADVRIEADVTLDGLRGFDRPVRLQATGPYIERKRGLPELDIDVTLGVQGAGQTVQFGLLRADNRAFVKFGGEFYEQSRGGVARANRALSSRGARSSGSLRDLGLLPRTWVVAARDEGEETVAGVQTRHVSGSIDVRSLLRDLGDLVERSGRAVASEGDVARPVSSSQLDRLADAVRTASFDVYVGKEDDVIRRFSVRLQVSVPEEDQASTGGLEGGAMRFSIEFSDVNGDQVVKAPANARPISDLTKQLGGLSALGGALGIDADGGATGEDTPSSEDRRGSDGRPAPRSEREDGVEAFRRYSDCLDKAGPNDTQALSRCAQLLR